MALTLADLLIEGALAGGLIAAPPTGPGGLCLVAPSGMSGAFVGKEGQLAGWTAAGRRFVVPIEGARLTIRCGRRGSGSTFMTARGGPGAVRADELVNGGCAWLEAPSRRLPIPWAVRPSSNVRARVEQILAALRGHGLIQT